MKKKISIAVIATVGVFVLGLGIYQSNASEADPKLSIDDIREVVSTQYPGTISEIEFEKGLHKSIYEVEVVSNGKEYELKLDGNTGEVLNLKEKSISNKDKEKIVLDNNDDQKINNTEEQVNDHVSKDEKAKKKNHQKESTRAKNQSTSNTKTVIDSKKAIEIAQESFDGIVTDFELDNEDGRLIYEIELKSRNEEADIEIDAYTGEVLVIEIEIDKSNKYGEKTLSPSNKSLLGAQKAIDIVQESFDGIVTELELDKEDGHLIYETKLKSSNEAAEIVIDAYTGEVFEVEIDD